MNPALSKHLHSLTLSLHVKNSVSSSRIFSVSRNWLCSLEYSTKFYNCSLLGVGNPNDFLYSNHVKIFKTEMFSINNLSKSGLIMTITVKEFSPLSLTGSGFDLAIICCFLI